MTTLNIGSGAIELVMPDSKVSLGAGASGRSDSGSSAGEDFGSQLQAVNREARQSTNEKTQSTQSVERRDLQNNQNETDADSINDSVDPQDSTQQASKRDVPRQDSNGPSENLSRPQDPQPVQSDHDQLGFAQLEAEGAGNALYDKRNGSAIEAPGVFLIDSDTTHPSVQTPGNLSTSNNKLSDLIEGVTYGAMSPEDTQKQTTFSRSEENLGTKRIKASVVLGRESQTPLSGEQLHQVGQLLPHGGGGSPILEGNEAPILNYADRKALAENQKRSGELLNNRLIALEAKSSDTTQSKKSLTIPDVAGTLATTKDTPVATTADSTLSVRNEQALAGLAATKTVPITESLNTSLMSTSISGQALSAESARPLLDAPGQLTRPSFVLHTPAGEPGWDAELGSRVRWLADRGNSLAELRLNPPELGSLTIRVSNDGERTSVTFFAQNPLARELLEAALPKLQAMFDQGDLQLADAEVSEHPIGHQAQGDGSEVSANESDSEVSSESGAAEDNVIANAYANRFSAVDYYV